MMMPAKNVFCLGTYQAMAFKVNLNAYQFPIIIGRNRSPRDPTNIIKDMKNGVPLEHIMIKYANVIERVGNLEGEDLSNHLHQLRLSNF